MVFTYFFFQPAELYYILNFVKKKSDFSLENYRMSYIGAYTVAFGLTLVTCLFLKTL
jgi:hypothetical protein